MDDRQRIAIFYDGSAPSALDMLRFLTPMADCVWVLDPSDPDVAEPARLLRRSGPIVDSRELLGGRRPGPIAAEGVNACVAYSDAQLSLAAQLCEALDLPGNTPATVEGLTSKVVQRERLRSHGVAGPEFRHLAEGSSPADLLRLANDLRLPLVVKPARSHSSRGALMIEDEAQLAALAEGLPDGSTAEDLIAEEYIPAATAAGPESSLGSYVSVELLAMDGRMHPLAITGKFALVDGFRETGNFMPHALSESDAAEVMELARHAAQALSVVSGVLHIEIKLSPFGPQVIEVNGRMAGGGISSLYQATHGRTLLEVAAAVSLGDDPGVQDEPPAAHDGPFHYAYFMQPRSLRPGSSRSPGWTVSQPCPGSTPAPANAPTVTHSPLSRAASATSSVSPAARLTGMSCDGSRRRWAVPWTSPTVSAVSGAGTTDVMTNRTSTTRKVSGRMQWIVKRSGHSDVRVVAAPGTTGFTSMKTARVVDAS